MAKALLKSLVCFQSSMGMVKAKTCSKQWQGVGNIKITSNLVLGAAGLNPSPTLTHDPEVGQHCMMKKLATQQ